MRNLKNYVSVDSGASSPFVDPPTLDVTFNGVNLDETIPFYKTLKINGLESFSVDFETQQMQSGVMALERRLPPRDITITFEMTPPTLTDRVTAMALLNYVLTSPSEPVSVYFAHIQNGAVWGQVAEVDVPKDDKLEFFGTFTIRCHDPHLRYGFNNRPMNAGYSNNTIYRELELLTITGTTVAGTNYLRTHNADITLDNLTGGQTIIINTPLYWAGTPTISVGGVNSLNKLRKGSFLTVPILRPAEMLATNITDVTVTGNERWR